MTDEHNNIPQKTEEQNNNPKNNGAAKPRGFTSKKNLIFLILVAVLTFAIGGAVLVAGVSNTPENRLSRHMRAAERYLAELDYERAVIEYQRALEIEPMNVDAILGLADAYIGLGEKEKAIEVLRDGLKRTGDKRIEEKLAKLTKPEEPPVPSESEEIPSEPEEIVSSEITVCTHEWKEATYAAPKICIVCGETEGEPKQTYFEEHGTPVKDAPVNCTVDAIIYNGENSKQQMCTDITWQQLDCYRELQEKEGYQLVYLKLLASAQCYYDSTKDIGYNSLNFGGGCYDWYTGRNFPTRSKNNDDTVETSVTIDIDGVSYDVSYTENVEWEWGDWTIDASGDYYKDVSVYITFIFKISEGYDGIVFTVIPVTEYNEEDHDYENIDERVSYALDDDECTEGTIFFRINKEGTVPLRQTKE